MSCDELAPHRGAIKRKMDEAVKPFFYVANMMDPVSQGKWIYKYKAQSCIHLAAILEETLSHLNPCLTYQFFEI